MFYKARSKRTLLYYACLILEVYAQQQITYSQQQQGTYRLMTTAGQTGGVPEHIGVQ